MCELNEVADGNEYATKTVLILNVLLGVNESSSPLHTICLLQTFVWNIIVSDFVVDLCELVTALNSIRSYMISDVFKTFMEYI